MRRLRDTDPAIPDFPAKLAVYHPGWYAAWNDLDPGTLQDLHTHYSLEQVAKFGAFDDEERNTLVLFKLHPLQGGKVREPNAEGMQAALPGIRSTCRWSDQGQGLGPTLTLGKNRKDGALGWWINGGYLTLGLYWIAPVFWSRE